MNNACMSVLSLRFEVVDGRTDWPVVKVLVDGKDPFAGVVPGWHGFGPNTMLGDESPLLPGDHGRRIAVYQCSCGHAGCGVIAPVIVASPDRTRVSWVDFRDYVGVFFTDPVEESVAEHEGKPWDLPDLHFDREQYVTEVERASRDDSWETPRRKTARLLHERLEPMGLVLRPDLRLSWISPTLNADGVTLMFEHIGGGHCPDVQQQVLRLTSFHTEPEAAAEHMARQLLSVQPDNWPRTFGRDRS